MGEYEVKMCNSELRMLKSEVEIQIQSYNSSSLRKALI